MTGLKWTIDAIWAMVAVGVTVAGGVYTTVYHTGATVSQLDTVREHQRDQDASIAANKQEVEDFKQHEAAVEQGVKDIQAQLDRIEKKL